MATDLLLISDLEPPMGDLSVGARLDSGRSCWAKRAAGEAACPKKRILHQRVVRLPGRARLDRLGLRPALGFHKCASSTDRDWVVDFQVRVRRRGRWQTLLAVTDLKRPRSAKLKWFDLGGEEADGVIIEVSRSGLDGWWPSWNLATDAFVLEGEILTEPPGRSERWLKNSGCDLARLPRGVEAWTVDGTVRYRTEDFEVGFRLDRPGFSFLSLGSELRANRDQNLLLTNPVKCDQGVQLHEVGRAPTIAPAIRCEIDGEVRVAGATISYVVRASGQTYELNWRVSSTGLSLKVVRSAAKTTRAWSSSVWTIGWDNAVSPTHAVGTMQERGQTGGMSLPVWVNAPGYGTWLIESSDPAAAVRSECMRHQDLHQLELKVGESAEASGLHRLRAGRHEAEFVLRPIRPPAQLQPAAPPVVQQAWERTFFVAPTFRADIATLANSGASMTCPICMDTWSAVLPHLGLSEAVPGTPSGADLLRISIERWLAGGPGYAAGRLSHGGEVHDADDEYLMTGAAILRAIGDYLVRDASRSWFRQNREVILTKIAAAKRRDLDGDGLIESPHRTGTSGSGQWSTCWLDVLSFGWKCAWSNAILFGALRELAAGFSRHQDEAVAVELRDWAQRLRAAYRPTFWAESSGWLAGWRCADDRLHDYAFLPVNGTAVREGLLEPDEAREVMQRMLKESDRVRMPDAALGLPMNLWPIPDEDRADILQGYPFGYYQNGGRTHSQTRHLVMALYAVGLEAEADALLERLCLGLAEAATFGGNRTGLDWRAWDDTPCGYEGLLTDQFGILEAIRWRWGSARD
jgi:hypothetical protein